MIRRILLIATLLAALLLAALPVSAADSDGTITGTIANGTTGVLPDEPLEVTLNSYINGDIEDVQSAMADADGAFSFTGLNTAADRAYVLLVTYNEVVFYGDLLNFEEGQTSLETTLDIFEPTDDLGVLTLATSHVIVRTDTAGLTVTEVYFLINDSTLAYNGLLAFSLPPNATPTDMSASLVWSGTEGGALVDTQPIPPGQRQVNYTYTVPAGTSYNLGRHVPLPMDQFNLLVQSGGPAVISPQLAKTDPLTISGATYDYYTGGPFGDGAALDITLGSPAGSAGGTSTAGVWLIVVAVILIVIAGFMFFRMRSGRRGTAGAGPAEDNSARWEELLDEIAALDDQLEAGTINEEEYRAVRDRTKAELKELMRRENDGGDE